MYENQVGFIPDMQCVATEYIKYLIRKVMITTYILK